MVKTNENNYRWVVCLNNLHWLSAPAFAQAARMSTLNERQVNDQRLHKVVIARIWHGRTRSSKADEYYEYLHEAGVKKIQAIEGNLGVQVLRRTTRGITE